MMAERQTSDQTTTKMILLIHHDDYYRWPPTIQILTTMGKEQACFTASAIQVLMKHLAKIEAIYFSIFEAKETANIIAPMIGINVPLIDDKGRSCSLCRYTREIWCHISEIHNTSGCRNNVNH